MRLNGNDSLAKSCECSGIDPCHKLESFSQSPDKETPPQGSHKEDEEDINYDEIEKIIMEYSQKNKDPNLPTKGQLSPKVNEFKKEYSSCKEEKQMIGVEDYLKRLCKTCMKKEWSDSKTSLCDDCKCGTGAKIPNYFTLNSLCRKCMQIKWIDFFSRLCESCSCCRCLKNEKVLNNTYCAHCLCKICFEKKWEDVSKKTCNNCRREEKIEEKIETTSYISYYIKKKFCQICKNILSDKRRKFCKHCSCNGCDINLPINGSNLCSDCICKYCEKNQIFNKYSKYCKDCMCKSCKKRYWEDRELKVCNKCICKSCGYRTTVESLCLCEVCGSDYLKKNLDPPYPGCIGHWEMREHLPKKLNGYRSFGYFFCENCLLGWRSAKANSKFKQGCKDCDDFWYPLYMWKNLFENSIRIKNTDEGPHLSELCEACSRGQCSYR